MTLSSTMQIEDRHSPPFFKKMPISIEHGEGVYVWNENGQRYLDFTSGWGVTCLGHAHPVIVEALTKQALKIIQNPNSGLTYSPARAQLLALMLPILPDNLTRVFFTNSGAEANDAAIKLARKATGRLTIISAQQSFHGRTISTVSATGQASHRDKFIPLMPHHVFAPYDDVSALEGLLDPGVAAVILEPIQGEGGVRVPAPDYLQRFSRLCKANGSLLIVDEIQTGFCRCGPMFMTRDQGVEADFLTMAKGIAGGFPLGAFAMTDAVAERLETGDHGGTYCGNPLGCAVAHAVIKHLIDNQISRNVDRIGSLARRRMEEWQSRFPQMIRGVRGKGLLLAVEFSDEKTAGAFVDGCLAQHLFVRQTQGNLIRIFPALNIEAQEMEEGLSIIAKAIISLSAREGATIHHAPV